MAKSLQNGLPEGLPEVFVSSREISSRVSREVAAGRLRRLASRLYTTNLTEKPESLIRRKLWDIVAGYFPKALIADRTALELKPAEDGAVFLITDSGRDVALPGITLKPRRGKGPVQGDYEFRDGLMCCSPARAYLENMRPSRMRTGTARTLKRAELEERLENLLRQSGKESFNAIRDQIKALAPKLDMKKEAKELDNIMGTILGTRNVPLASTAGRARKAGSPFDPRRVEKFEALHDHLRRLAPQPPRLSRLKAAGMTNRAFFEAYFSNFIEGTEFEVEEARDIIFHGAIPAGRPADAHDILGTYRLVSDKRELSRIPATDAELVEILRDRHKIIMGGRKEKNPGVFKDRQNRVGTTTFVAPEDVVGTLREGFRIYRLLGSSFHRAVFMMFMVSEVHPFADGNGRLARIMMNAELVSTGEVSIIIPTVFRSNYLSSLRAMTINGNPEPLVKALDFAQKYTSLIPWGSFEQATLSLEETNAFVNPEQADESGERLILPQ